MHSLDSGAIAVLHAWRHPHEKTNALNMNKVSRSSQNQCKETQFNVLCAYIHKRVSERKGYTLFWGNSQIQHLRSGHNDVTSVVTAVTHTQLGDRINRVL